MISFQFDNNFWLEFNTLVKSENYSRVAVLVDSNTYEHCLPQFAQEFEREFEVIEIEPGEASKDLVICSHIWMQLSESMFDRDSLLINLGGGVVTDLGGFIAGVYMRGIDFINIPTSLLAMVDAAIGHKCGIDFMHLKNQLGLFNAPKAVFISTSWLKTLNQQNLCSAFAEMLKHGLINSKDHFNNLISLNTSLDGIVEFIEESINIKKRIVESDTKESSLRRILNFGHTIGHALESHLLQMGNPVLHGYAVASGMLIESRISKRLNLLSEVEFSVIESSLLKYFKLINFSASDVSALIKLMQHDKKSKAGEIHMALIDGIGSSLPFVSVEEETIEVELISYTNDYKA